MMRSSSSDTPRNIENTPDASAEDVFVFPASYAQQRLWFFYQLNPDSPVYNSPIALRLTGPLDVEALKQSFNEIVRRHEILRTTFPAVEGRPVQVVAQALTLSLPVIDLRELSETEQEAQVQWLAAEEALRLFDLAQGPLLRTTLLRLDGEDHALLTTMHHIVADGWSAGVFMRELVALYEALSAGKPSPLPNLPIQYADFALWQLEWLQGEVLETQLAYWQERLADIPTLELPIDRPRPAIQTFQGARQSLVIPKRLTEALKALGEREGATLFMTLLAAFQVLLCRYTGQDDVIVGSPIANRNQVELEELIGFFANTLVLRTHLSGNPTFRELLGRVRDVCTGAYAHQDLPFEKLVEELHPERDLSRNPLFQVFFALQSAPMPKVGLEDLALSLLELESGVVRFDLELHLSEVPQGLYAVFVYNKDLFDASTIVRMAGHFETLLEGIAVGPWQRLSGLPLLTDAERHQLLVKWNNTRADYPRGKCIHDLFEAQVERTPDAVAVVFEDEQLTYRELNRRANQLAHYLQALDVGPEVRVGICLEHSLEEVVGLLGILKAGGAYVPLEAGDPKRRVAFIVEDAQVAVVLTQERLVAGLPEHGGRVVCLDSYWEVIAQQSEENPVSAATAEGLAYILYSWSRGVPVDQGGVCNRLQWLQDEFDLSGSDAVLHKASLGQDTSVWEVFWPLLYGGRLVIAAAEGQEDAGYLQRVIAGQDVNIVHFVPSELAAFLRFCEEHAAAQPSALRWVLCSGEPLQRALVDTFFQYCAECGLYNLYSLPEAATEVTAQVCQPDTVWDTLPVGRPTNNISVCILDEHLQPVPIGVSGEVYVAGEGLARGYLHDSGGTSERFVKNPFSEIPGERLFKTGDLGRWLSNGTVQLLDAPGRQVWIGGFRVELDEVEAAMLAEPSVDGCAVTMKETGTFGRELVAYVVPAGPFAPERLQSHVEAVLPAIMRPSACVPLSPLPLTSRGEMDERALARLEVIDADLVQRWEDRLQAVPGIERVAVVVEEQAERQPVLHLSDLLLEWQAAAENAVKAPEVAWDQAGGQALAPAQVMALSDGGPLSIPASAPKTLTEALVWTAETCKEKGILFVQSDGRQVFQSYAMLLEGARRVVTGLYEQGLQPGDRAILQVETQRDYFTAFWGCVLGGIKPVTVAIAPTYAKVNTVVNKLRNVWELLEHPTILASLSLVKSLAGLETLCGMKGLNILSVDELKGYRPAEQVHESQPCDVIFYQLTSGSTGAPKCIQETHRGIIAHIHGSAQFNEYTPDDVTLNWLPMDHVVPILTFHLKDVYLGCQQIHVKTDLILADPLKWLDLMEAYRVTHTWSPNFGFKLVSDRLATTPGSTWDLSSMKFFMNAGEQVTLPVVRDFLDALAPFGVRQQAMQPAFGMAEVCTCMTYQNDFNVERGVHRVLKSSLDGTLQKAGGDVDDVAAITFVDLGPPIPGVQIRITDTKNNLLPEGVIGRFQIKGDVLTPGYLYNDAANQESFVGDGWLNSGDLGFILNGRLTLTGREKEMIIVRGANFYCYEIEDVVNNIEGVEPTFVGACAVEDASTGTEGLAIFFVPKATATGALADLVKTVRREVTAQTGIAPMFVIPLTKEEFPKTTSGKIQRSRMKKSLAAGEYQEVLKEVDLLLENANTLPSWFYRKIWRRKRIATLTSQTRKGLCLVFLDRLGLGGRLCAELGRLNQACIGVEAGADFARLDADHYRIDPRNPGHYRRLLASLAEDKQWINQVLHLWTYNEYAGEVSSMEALGQAQNQGIYSLLFLAQALAQTQDTEHSVRLYVISSHTQPVSPGCEIAYEKAPMLGLIKTIPQEMSWLNCRHIDLPVEDVEVNVTRVLREMQTVQGDQEVAYRQRERLVARLEKVDVGKGEKREITFKPGGLYLLSGGLGGIGAAVAKYLLENYRARLLLVGRTSLPERSAWKAHLEQGDGVSERIETLLTLEQLGGEVVYEAVDVCDLDRLRQAVDRAKSRWDRELGGVIHLAGVFQERLLVEETHDSLAAALRAKVLGTWVLHQLIKDRPKGVFITFSSVNGFFGGAMVGAYAAANSFLDCFSYYQRYKSSLRSHCFAWSMWDEVGIGRDYQMKDLSSARGYYAITTEQGLHSLFAGLHHDQAHLLVGLDGSNPHIRRYWEVESHPLQKLIAYLQADHVPVAQLQELEVQDRFQTRSTCEFRQIQQMPLTDMGEIDREKLLAKGRRARQVVADRVAPRTELERQLASIWQEVLQKEVGIYDNFFDLGGSSMLLIQAQSKLYAAFNREISTTELFRYPTISALAKYLGGEQMKQLSFEQSLDRAEIRRESARRRKQLRQEYRVAKNHEEAQ